MHLCRMQGECLPPLSTPPWSLFPGVLHPTSWTWSEDKDRPPIPHLRDAEDSPQALQEGVEVAVLLAPEPLPRVPKYQTSKDDNSLTQ